MQIERVLFSWIGRTDLKQQGLPSQLGPIESILKIEEYDVIVLLHTESDQVTTTFIDHLRKNYSVEIINKHFPIKDPTNYRDVYIALDEMISEYRGNKPDVDITLQVTSGTPQMTAMSLLLGKAKHRTKFIQSSLEQGVIAPEIPFEIAAELQTAKSSEAIAKLFTGEAPDTAAFSDIITQSPEMDMLKNKAAIIAKRNVPVLIYGETGTGKELFAKAIHNTSERSDKPMLVLNCGAIPRDLIDTTLFGHEKGAFTGAIAARDGYFKKANGGTLFLDEFGEMPLESQVRLLRVIQEGTYSPIGATEEYHTDVRIIAATNKDLTREISEGRFREDLFYRVAIGILHLPSLSQRTDDPAFLASALLKHINQEASQEPNYKHKNLSASAINFIKNHSWPGNVRELQATLLRASLWQAGDIITDDDIANAIIQTGIRDGNILNKNIAQGIDINAIFSTIASEYITKALLFCNGNKTKAAALLGLKNYQTLNNWIDRYNIK